MSVSGISGTTPPSTTPVSQAGVAPADAAGALAVEKMQVNVSIVQASYEVSIGAHNQPLQMVFKSAINSLNETLKPVLGDNAIQNATNQDNTPEGTAGRIVSLATNLFSSFQSLHPEQSQASAANDFLAFIRQGIDQGFKEARGILDGLGVLQGDIADNIDKTYALIQQKLGAFLNTMQGAPEGEKSSPTST